MTPTGDGFQTVDVFRKRTPTEIAADLHADYGISFGGRWLSLLADAFNLFNPQGVQAYNPTYELSSRRLNSDFGVVTQVQDPHQVRIGVRLQF